MAGIADRLQRLERMVGERFACGVCSLVVIVVVRPGEDAASKMPGPCSKCGRDRNVIVVASPLPGRPGSAMKAVAAGIDPAGSLRIDDPVIAPPVPEVSPGVTPTTKQPDSWPPAGGLPLPPRFVPRHEIVPERPAPSPEYDPLDARWR